MQRTDLLVFVILLVFSLLFVFIIPPVNVGFFCDDESIRYPYIKPDSMVPSSISILFTFLISTLTILTIEFVNSKHYLLRFVVEFIPFFFGYLVAFSMTMYCKCLVGRMRPYFLDYCRFNMSQCTDPVTNEIMKGVYIQSIICQNSEENEALSWFSEIDSRTSFPSGYTSMTSYSLLYLSIYIHHKFPNFPILFRSVIQFALINLALFFGYQQLDQYRHHWGDVFAGIILGFFIAIVTLAFIRPYYIVRLVSSGPINEELENLITDGSTHILLQPVNNRRNSYDHVDSLSQIKQFMNLSTNSSKRDHRLSIHKKDSLIDPTSSSKSISKNTQKYQFYKSI